MKRQTLSAGLALALDLFLFGAIGRAELLCEQPVHQAGQVRNGMPLTHRFKFINVGQGTLEITDLRSTCGCLTPTLAKHTYGPGESGSLLLEINTLALAEGTQSWRTRLTCREGATTSELELVVVGDVVTEVLVQPTALTLPAEAPGVHEITVTDRRPHSLTVRAADTGAACLKATVGPVQREGGMMIQRVRLEVPGDCPEGRHDVALHLYTNDPLYREFKIPVTIVKRPRQHVSATPGQVTFDGDKGEPLPSRLVRLSAADGAEVEVERVGADDPAVRCTLAKGPGAWATVTIEIDHTRLTGDLKTMVRVRLLKPAVETVTIPVVCIVR